PIGPPIVGMSSHCDTLDESINQVCYTRRPQLLDGNLQLRSCVARRAESPRMLGSDLPGVLLACPCSLRALRALKRAPHSFSLPSTFPARSARCFLASG